MQTNKKAITPIVATILLVVVAVILVTVILSWEKDFSNKSLSTADTGKLSKSNASEFVYTKAFSDGIIQFNYGPPDSLTSQNIVITGYKIFSDNNETTEIILDSNHTLSQGLNIIPLTSFSDQNITSRKMNIQLKTSDGKYITLNNVTNNEPYVAEPYVPQQYNTGALSPGTMADDASIGTVAWINPNNAKISDNNRASVAHSGLYDSSHYLKATNFDFNIPTGAIIDGIKVEIEKFANNNTDGYNTTDSRVSIVKSNEVGTANKKKTERWSITETYISYGDINDLWGETWTVSQINDANFGVVISEISYNEDYGIIAYIDHIRMTVYYTN